MSELALPVRIGLWESDKPMTRAQAERLGRARMNYRLKQAGFSVFVHQSNPEMHGGSWFRVNYGKRIAW